MLSRDLIVGAGDMGVPDLTRTKRLEVTLAPGCSVWWIRQTVSRSSDLFPEVRAIDRNAR